MKEEMFLALHKEIEKWGRIAFYGEKYTGQADCELCKLYYHDQDVRKAGRRDELFEARASLSQKLDGMLFKKCTTCPINQRTDYPNCEDTDLVWYVDEVKAGRENEQEAKDCAEGFFWFLIDVLIEQATMK